MGFTHSDYENDLRKPNKVVILDSYPLPHMEHDTTVLSTIDLASAYQPTREPGLDSFSQSPTGLSLRNIQGAQGYLDDIVIYGHTKEEHDRNLQAVLNPSVFS